jgi:hypothetical protein
LDDDHGNSSKRHGHTGKGELGRINDVSSQVKANWEESPNWFIARLLHSLEKLLKEFLCASKKDW